MVDTAKTSKLIAAYLDRDGCVRLNEEEALVALGVRLDPHLELLLVGRVRLVEVRSAQISRGLHLAVAHVLYPGWQVVLEVQIQT